MHDAHSGPTPPADASHPEERDMSPPSVDQAIHEAPHQIGLHGSAAVSNAVFQRYDDTCVIRCQQLVLQQYGVQVSQEQLIHEAKEFGWYRDGHGVSGRHVGDLLSVHGVENAKYQNANVFNLATELAQGHKVIIGVDSGDLWGHHPIREWLENAVGIRAADHAVIVSGIDTTDPNDVKVIITDPGTGDVAKPYPLADFLSAWKDSNFFMVATKNPAPLEFNPEMAHFNYQTGHLPFVGRLEYDHFSHDYSACSDAPAD
ncbi:MAG TPA: hypothetical protein PLV92_22405, partial [Pirellulaceae bacterium]|nr:hypothetical protein [Pirellulaceae bacterium]